LFAIKIVSPQFSNFERDEHACSEYLHVKGVPDTLFTNLSTDTNQCCNLKFINVLGDNISVAYDSKSRIINSLTKEKLHSVIKQQLNDLNAVNIKV